MNDESFSETCLKCDLRSDVKKRVTYTTLSIIITVSVVFTGASYTTLTSTLSGLRTDVKTIGNAVSICQNRMSVMETEQDNDRGMIRHLDKEIKRLNPNHNKQYYEFKTKRPE